MWGSSFADFAKKAQELQDQAAEAAHHLSVSSSELWLRMCVRSCLCCFVVII